MTNKSALGILLGLATGIFWALCSPVSKLLGDAGVPMSTVVFCRAAGTALVVGIWMMAFCPRQLRLTRSQAVNLFFCSLLGPIGLYLGFMLSVFYLPVATALVLHYTYPTVTALGSSLVTGEKPNHCELLGALLVIVGVAFSVMKPDWSLDTALSPKGLAWGLLAIFGAAEQTLRGRAAATRGGASSVAVFFYTHLFGSVWISLYKTMADGWSDFVTLTAAEWGLIAAVTLITTIIAYSAYYTALKYISAPTASLLASVEIVGAVILTSLAVRTWPTIPEMLGCAIIFCAIGLAAWGKMAKGNPPAKDASVG